jgi:GNAT superfamily N-acetyltransferase
MLYHALYVPPGAAPLPRKIVQRPELARYVTGWGREHDMGFAALDATTGQAAGAAWIRLLSGENRGYGYVDDATPELSIAVLPAWRGQGIGAALLGRLVQAAQPHYRALSLSVAVDNPAVRLYSRLGFRVVRSDGASLIMLKTIDRVFGYGLKYPDAFQHTHLGWIGQRKGHLGGDAGQGMPGQTGQ